LPRALRAQALFDTDVVIVGAGPAGLGAARACARAAKRFVMLEARDRIGGRVFTDRAWPLDLSELPAWRVIAEDESVERLFVEIAVNQHELTVACEGIVRAVANLDDAMHALAAQGMAAIFAPPVPYELQLTAIDRMKSVMVVLPPVPSMVWSVFHEPVARLVLYSMV
ncbi:MAG: NAD(P)-binding protein, partial [Verrucomicrobiota bacterium]